MFITLNVCCYSKGEFTVLSRDKETVTVQYKDNKAVVYASPFKIEFYKGDSVVAVLNARGLFEFEHFRKKKEEGWVMSIFRFILSFKNKLLLSQSEV